MKILQIKTNPTFKRSTNVYFRSLQEINVNGEDPEGDDFDLMDDDLLDDDIAGEEEVDATPAEAGDDPTAIANQAAAVAGDETEEDDDNFDIGDDEFDDDDFTLEDDDFGNLDDTTGEAPDAEAQPAPQDAPPVEASAPAETAPDPLTADPLQNPPAEDPNAAAEPAPTTEPAPAEPQPAPAEDPNEQPAQGGGDAAPVSVSGDAGGDDNFDMGDMGGDPNAAGGDVGAQPAPAAPAPKAPQNPTDGIKDEEIRNAEQEIYNGLTDDQKRIRTLQLKLDFKELYSTIVTTTEGVNLIPKKIESLVTISKLLNALSRMKTMLIDYIENNFDMSSYIENYVIYLKYMNLFRTIAKVVEELADVKKN